MNIRALLEASLDATLKATQFVAAVTTVQSALHGASDGHAWSVPLVIIRIGYLVALPPYI